MKLLALDMTLRNTGYSVWSLRKRHFRRSCEWRWTPLDCGCISVPALKTHEYKMVKEIKNAQTLLRELDNLVRKHDIRAVVVELLAGSQSSSAAKTFGIVEGVLAAVLEKHRMPVYAYPASEVKKLLTGNRSASKNEMTEAVKELFPELFKRPEFKKKKNRRTGKIEWPKKLEHITDSIALVTYAEDQEDFRMITQLAVENAEKEEEEESVVNDDFFD